ncbi:MAG: REP-associated tyrosine transposase [Spirochaetaceae bacterium]
MRARRRLVIGATYHVVARANRREFILSEQKVKELFLVTLSRARRKFAFEVVSLCVMENHFHLVIRPGKNESLSLIMQWLLSVFAINFNRRKQLHGHVWYDRFKSNVIGSLRQYQNTLRYIANNPVRAGIVCDSRHYAYSAERLSRDGPPGIVDPPSLLIKLLFPELGRLSLASS